MNFGFLVFPNLEELDLVGPWEMVAMWSQHLHGPERCLLVAQQLTPITCAKGLSLNPHVDFAGCPALDFLLVPGGQGTRTEVANETLIRFVAEQARHAQAVLSAGIDLALAFIESVAGETVAGKVQLGAEYYPSGRRYGGFDQGPGAPAYLKRPTAG